MAIDVELKPYYAIALDPVHVGTGGTRLGRVDLPILREPGTNLPKIPGSTLSGCARLNTALAVGKLQCAGQGGEGGEKHCGCMKPACEVCVPFGFSKGRGRSLQGLAQFFDAHILFYPVTSMVGPIWVTAPAALDGLGCRTPFAQPKDGFIPLGQALQTTTQLNCGWLLLQKETCKGTKVIPKEVRKILPDNLTKRTVLVGDALFSRIVNSNLEVRTSVSIDPQTGAAEEGALFTYEAIPRGTVFKFEILYNSGKNIRVGREVPSNGNNQAVDPEWVKDKVEKGLDLFSTLGVGGMNTRGMGRIAVQNIKFMKG